ncbi:MAG: alpha-1,2-fucosyltransferase [Lachnospiraceae bacterium]|jgi:hypothetical protein|nr:alpha-1,2-fucosyltransferase [Lachnospiraceae bacterium]
MIELILYGGLGNQLFEYAFARSKQLESDDKLLLINTYLFNNYQFDDSLKNFNLPKNVVFIKKPRRFIRIISECRRIIGDVGIYRLLSPFGIYVWRVNKYKKIECKNKKNYIYGYFQTEKYFDKYFKEIKSELKLKSEYHNSAFYEKIVNSNSVCIHVRRGDYCKLNMIICDLAYFQRAVEIMKDKLDNPTFFLFSDDVNWVKNNFKIKGINFVDEKTKDYEQLSLMSNCKHFIISNSTFSWWAQYLSENPDKLVIAPTMWMPYDTERRDIYQKNWILI